MHILYVLYMIIIHNLFKSWINLFIRYKIKTKTVNSLHKIHLRYSKWITKMKLLHMEFYIINVQQHPRTATYISIKYELKMKLSNRIVYLYGFSNWFEVHKWTACSLSHLYICILVYVYIYIRTLKLHIICIWFEWARFMLFL